MSAPHMSIRDLAVMSYVYGITQWHYKPGKHSIPEILSPGYFDEARDRMAPGDFIFVSGEAWGAIFYVTSIVNHVVVKPMAVS